MSEELNEIVITAVKNQQEAAKIVEKLFAVAQPGVVFSEPVTVGEYTVITASEVKVGMGVGYGIGSGTGTAPAQDEATGENEPQQGAEGSGAGGGGGGGGVSGGRPVAVISIGPKGVQVEPVIDSTKTALAFFTMMGSMFLMFSKMRKASKG